MYLLVGLRKADVETLINSDEVQQLKGINIVGLMGMSTNTSDENQVKSEFNSLKVLFDQLNTHQLINPSTGNFNATH